MFSGSRQSGTRRYFVAFSPPDRSFLSRRNGKDVDVRPQAWGLGPAAAAAAGTQTESSPTNLFLAILPAPSPYGTRAAATRSSLPLPPPPPPPTPKKYIWARRTYWWCRGILLLRINHSPGADLEWVPWGPHRKARTRSSGSRNARFVMGGETDRSGGDGWRDAGGW